MDYPTEEEMAEFYEYAAVQTNQPMSQPQSQPLSQQFPTEKNTPSSNRGEHSFFHNSTQLSQIPPNDTVNRRLFGTPLNDGNHSNRLASTPFSSANGCHTPNPYRFRFDDDEFENNLPPIEQNPRKRRLDLDLFGDIDDIVREEQRGAAQVFYSDDVEENAKKKARSEEEQDNMIIERILAARADLQAKNNNIMKQSKLQQLEALHQFKARNLSEVYPKWPCIPVVTDRSRIYVRMHNEEFEKNQLNELTLRKSFGKLLGEHSDDVWNEAQKIVTNRMTQQAQSQAEQLSEIDEVVIVNEAIPNAGKLWVEKYKPKGYFDLLSDESTNRSLLTWLKMWDKIVFGRSFQKEKDLTNEQKNAASNFNKKTGRFEVGSVRFRKHRPNDLKTEIDSHGRPIQKIAVLCGPPGLGKTTLAHTIARHAGYTVREINASDDRSPECFRLALQNGTEMQTTLLDQEKRPNCIILDEIDGAPLASIEFLLKFINDQTKEVKKSKAPTDKAGGKKPKASGILRRPIICICNDIYAPSLRPLRQVAFIVTFPPLDSGRLAERLYAIARKERLTTDMTTLMALAEKSGNDVRSCISVLQFFANSRKPLDLVDVMKSNIGQKDKQKGLFEIWSSVFQIQRYKGGFDPVQCKAIGASVDTTIQIPQTVDTSMRSRVEHVLNVVHMGGDNDRLVNGVFENYLSQKVDGNLLNITEAGEWFCFTDILNTQIQTVQNYSVYPYLPYTYVAWHLLFAGISWPKITFPTQGFEYYQKSSTQKTIRASFVKSLSVMVRSLANSPTIISDAVASIRQIICPSLRSVSLQLLTPKERADLAHTVDVMVDLGLTYAQTKNPDGTYQYQLEPDINFLCNFKVNQWTNELTYSNMQIIAREVELQTMRRSAPKDGGVNTTKSNKAPLSKPKPQNHLQKLNTKSVNMRMKMKELVTKDFFGRITEKRVALPVQEGGRDQIVKSPIWYRYKEGYNNAVRKDLTLQSLL
ncbi:chromosome transmission fidelity protein 18 homolog [Contarinia nasturtii]|uniref:chromosome transmission fidelity protein 18 homolog n=1 Tax=Contarinia nasturtii TaxID=265458 RepID=UPI0012D43725|nr:chromosome transmission fidelity protein 18 homolog [Contarinia nasturtii]